MKHTPSVTTILITLFITSQLIGLALLATGLNTTTDEQGNITVNYEETAIGERPETTGINSLLYLLIGITIGTLLLLLLAKFGLTKIWKIWFFLAVWLTISIAIGILTPQIYALSIGFILAAWKIFKPNMIVHNLTEILVYTGIAFLLVPLFELLYAIILLIAIALYDAYAVWKSKHMISLAKFQTKSNIFAGLLVNYKTSNAQTTKPNKTTTKKTENKSAILGGGDIAFPLIFTGTTLNWLLTKGLTKIDAYLLCTIIIVGATTSLIILFLQAKKDHFYPAMPFITTGCLLGLGLIALII